MPCKLKKNHIQLNKKGYPTIGLLCPTLEVNPYIVDCDTLENTAKTFVITIEITYGVANLSKQERNKYQKWTDEIYRKLFDFINRDMKPTFDGIDIMLLVSRILLERNMKTEIAEFILNCPNKFLLTYANNSEQSPFDFIKLRRLGLNNICKYLLTFVHYTKLNTWNERINSHVRGNLRFECKF
jgi:hypothetical protein